MFADKTIGDIVRDHHQSVRVFEKYHIDFCCGGGRLLKDVVEEKRLDAEQFFIELATSVEVQAGDLPDFGSMETVALIDYILAKHHAFIRERGPVLVGRLNKLATVHGSNHPELIQIRDVFNRHYSGLVQHLMKEEMMLFPYIKAMEENKRTGKGQPSAVFPSVQHPIRMMEYEHVEAGADLRDLRELSNHFSVPEDGCNTYRIGFQELREWEMDIHQHIHLENNILHKRAQVLEESFA
ncbi:MAG: iron-sulfur cluster repair di-iron protein [Bacteroidetes bacterium]|nr:iron-sulfur cluster repair di-iron protein [Bacteroidota bacterium]